MTDKMPSILMYLVSIWLIVVGVVDITFDQVQDLPWIARMIESDNLSSFDRPLDILTTWIGLLLISAGTTLAVLAGVIRESRRARILLGQSSPSCGLPQLTLLLARHRTVLPNRSLKLT
jgi:hypothetical protein